ncbi:MAG: hypothetical protein H6814_00660 [Phycisphaeraceae bacterium]|nr:hypothetical protein [Phycisphaeraceae bacterium]
MSAASEKRNDRIESLLERARGACDGGDWFQSETLACEAMELSYKGGDFLRMSLAVEALRGCRMSRREHAVSCGAMYAFDSDIGDEDYELAEGCWLVEPPRVGADGRDLRELATQSKIAMLAISREPMTTTGLWPLVAVGPMVIRARIRPPREITPEWFIDAVEALGASAIDDVDPDASAIERVEELFLRLQTIPDSLGLHETLLGACREAAGEHARAGRSGGAGQSAA